MLIHLSAFFLALLNQSVVASFVILGVLCVRLLLKPAPKIYSYLLWGVVFVRLLCPLSLESEFSIIPITSTPVSAFLAGETVATNAQTGLPEDAMQNQQTIAPEQGASYLPNSLNAPNTPPDQLLADAVQTQPATSVTEHLAQGGTTMGGAQVGQGSGTADAQSTLAGQQAGAVDITAQATSVSRSRAVLQSAFILWVAGAALLLGYSGYSLTRLRRRLAGAQWQPQGFYHAAGLETAFVFGVLSPKIYLPKTLSETERAYVLLHEQTHLKRGDHIIKLVAFAALCLHWFNPLVWLAYFLCDRDMEMSCDERVLQLLQKQGGAGKQAYSLSLLSLATGRRMIGGMPLSFGAGDTKSRIQNVLRYRKPTFWGSVAAGLVLVIAMLLFFTTRQTNNPAPTEGTGDAPPPMREVVLPVDNNQQGSALDELSQIKLNLALLTVQDAVDALNAAGASPTEGESYYVTGLENLSLVPQNTGAANNSFAVGVDELIYTLTLSTTEDIVLPEGYCLVEGARAPLQEDASKAEQTTLYCVPTEEMQPYLYVFGGAFTGKAQYQALGVMYQNEIKRYYGGPARLSYYGDAITASGGELLQACVQDDVDFNQFHFAPPDGLKVDREWTTWPARTVTSWNMDTTHLGHAQNISIDFYDFAMGEASKVVAYWQDAKENGLYAFEDVVLGGVTHKLTPTLYGIYTDDAGEKYLFAYASRVGDAASLGGADYAYALYALADDRVMQEVERGFYAFAPGESTSAEGVPLTTALETINAYGAQSVVILSTDRTVQYFTEQGEQVTLPFAEDASLYMNIELEQSDRTDALAAVDNSFADYYTSGVYIFVEKEVLIDFPHDIVLSMQAVPQ